MREILLNTEKSIILSIITCLLYLNMKLFPAEPNFTYSNGGIIRADCSQKMLALIFTGGDFGDGGLLIRKVLKEKNVPASFFFTGDFYRNPNFKKIIAGLHKDGHYLGAHSDKHLLYCSWEKRDSLLVTKQQFVIDLLANYAEMKKFGIEQTDARFFMPAYEWYNDSISVWTKEMDITLINYTPGTLSNTDYTIPSMKNYRSTETIYNSIVDYEKINPRGLNGFLLLIHIGTDPERTDKFYYRLAELIDYLHKEGYTFVRIDKLLAT